MSCFERVAGLAAGWMLFASLSASGVRAADGGTITDVEVQQEEGVTRVILRGAEDPIYTAFMREDPAQLIIELPDVSFDGIDMPVAVRNALVRDVALAAIDAPRVSSRVARVSISLVREAEYEILPGGNELVIELRPLPSGANEPGIAESPTPKPTEESPAAPSVREENPAPAPRASEGRDRPEPPTQDSETAKSRGPAALDETAILAESETATQPAPLRPSRIEKVEVGASEIRIQADGPIDNVDSFVLDDPERIVVDFWGAQNQVFPGTIDVKAGVVRQVRIGQHVDKVRVVMDLRSAVASHVVEPTEEGVHIVLETEARTAEESPVLSKAVPAAPAEEFTDSGESELDGGRETRPVEEETSGEGVAPSMAPTLGDASEVSEIPESAAESLLSHAPIQVESVFFESLSGADRVVLELPREPETHVAEPDAASVVIDLPGVRIDEQTERRVDTREFGGPLELFSVFQTPDIEGDQVRIVLKRSGALTPVVGWADGHLTIELPRSDDSGDAQPSNEAVVTPGGTAPQSPGEPSAPSAPTAEVAPRSLAGASAPVSPSAPTPVVPGEIASLTPVPGAPPGPLPAAAPLPTSPLLEDPMLGGPADPASIDVLEEGGFNEEKAYKGRRISLDFKDADIGNILRLIAEVSDLNIIAGEEVEGKVTIRLVDVPWDQAMDVILMTKGLGFLRVGNVLRIAPLETLKLEQEARLQERRAKEKLEDLVVKLQPVNYASVKEVQELVQRLLSARGSVNVDERTNTLIIKDIPAVIHEATALVKAIDTQTPQVLIEAKIVEATLNFSRSLGAIWGGGYVANGSDGGDGEFRLADGTADTLLSNAVGNGKQQTNFISSNPVTGIVNGFLTLGTLGLDDHLQLDLQLLAAEENNKGKVISSPRVVTLDNREAVIKQGVAIKFTEITRDTVTTSFVDAVLELEVTPHITANRAIIMKIKVSRNAPQLSTSSGDIVGIAKNETETEALVQDGETMVLGGIYVVDNGKANTKFPFLADIPLIGTAFKSKSITDARRELLIFVTPRIVRGPASEI
ncbi:MAG: type IV pilus secretin PilQ [Myxococcota bacterium]